MFRKQRQCRTVESQVTVVFSQCLHVSIWAAAVVCRLLGTYVYCAARDLCALEAVAAREILLGISNQIPGASVNITDARVILNGLS